jgi:hypothetical protein
MGIQINQYPLTATEINNEDYFDVDQWNGSAFESKKVSGEILRNQVIPRLFTQTADQTVTATTTETTLIGTGLGTLVVPANTFQVGDTFQLKMCGYINAHNNDTFTFKLKSGSTILATSGAITMSTATAKVFELMCDFCIRAIGSTGVAEIVSNGSFGYNKNGSNTHEGQNFLDTNNTTFNTTIGNTLDITVQFSSTNAGNSMRSKVVYLTKVY